ncbi:MAG: hypothetical protein GY795_20950 [Desulfobacterales bacterium]|nr:hypothetical protein [Desulfobacterales bacterium]
MNKLAKKRKQAAAKPRKRRKKTSEFIPDDSNDRISRLPLPVNDREHFDLSKWGGIIAHNIYRESCPHGVKVGPPQAPLDPKKDPKEKITKLEQLNRYGCIIISLHPRWKEKLGPTPEERLKNKIKETFLGAPLYISPDIADKYSPEIRIFFKGNNFPSSSFDLTYLPNITSTSVIECDGYMRVVEGKVQVPGCSETPIKVGLLDNLKQNDSSILPLYEGVGNIIKIGTEPDCHIKTSSSEFDAILKLRWDTHEDTGIAGTIMRLDYENYTREEELYIKIIDNPPEYFFEKKPYYIPETNNPTSMCKIIRKAGNHEKYLIYVFFKNDVYDFRELPGCIAFRKKLDTIFSSKENVAKFIATQIYLTSKNEDNKNGDILFLEDRNSPIAPLVSRNELCPLVNMGISPARWRQLHTLFGGKNTAESIIDQVLSIITDKSKYPDYYEAFEKKTGQKQTSSNAIIDALKGGNGRKGLSINVFDDILIPNNTCLLRVMPLIDLEPGNKIYGEIDLAEWAEIKNLTGLSFNDRRAFLIEQPKDTINIRISCFPLYGLHTKKIKGTIIIELFISDTKRDLSLTNNTMHSIWIDNREIIKGDEETIDVVKLQYSKNEGHYLLELSPDKNKTDVIKIKIYDQPREQQDENEFISRPGKLELHGITLAKRIEIARRLGKDIKWIEASDFYKLWQKTGLDDKELAGVHRITNNGYIAILDEDRIHYFSGNDTRMKFGNQSYSIPKNHSTHSIWGSKKSLPSTRITFTEENSSDVIYLLRSFNEASNARLLLPGGFLPGDLHEYLFDVLNIEYIPPDQGKVKKLDLLRCDHRDVGNSEKHLYYAISELNGDERGWLIRKQGGINYIYSDIGYNPKDLDFTKEVVGPIRKKYGNFFRVEWEGEKDPTPFSFDVDPHIIQIEDYLSCGYFSLVNGVRYDVGGLPLSNSKPYDKEPESFVSTVPLELRDKGDGNILSFDQREYCIYFDKESFTIYYEPEIGMYAVKSRHHPKKDGITPKTVFMVLPYGGHPKLGSHALPYVELPPGENYIMLPGLTFKFSYGKNYYTG